MAVGTGGKGMGSVLGDGMAGRGHRAAGGSESGHERAAGCDMSLIDVVVVAVILMVVARCKIGIARRALNSRRVSQGNTGGYTVGRCGVSSHLGKIFDTVGIIVVETVDGFDGAWRDKQTGHVEIIMILLVIVTICR